MTEPIESPQAGADGIEPSMLARPAAVSSVEQLVAVRQEAGMSASDVASRLGMATRQIEALERGDWQALPGQAFVRAALRAYGKALRTDVEPLLDSIGGRVSAPELKASASLESPIPRGGGFGFGTAGTNGRLAWIVLGIAAVIAIVFYFGPAFELGDRSGRETVALSSQTGASPERTGSPDAGAGVAVPQTGQPVAADAGSGAAPSSGAAPVAAAPSLTPLAPLAPLTPAPGSTSAAGVAPGSPAGGAPAPSATPATPPATPPAAAPASAGTAGVPSAADKPASPSAAGGTAAGAATPGADAGTTSADSETIRLRFGRESWVEIRESGGKIILTGLQPAGSERELSGRRPLSLVIGNAEHVTLERAGKPFDLASRARQGVARITLD